jgi:hypothetical protein
MGIFANIDCLFTSDMNQTHTWGINAKIKKNLVPKIFHATKLILVFWHNHLPLVFSRFDD